MNRKNIIILGDNYKSTIRYIDDESIDLISTDPLWKTGKNWLAADDAGTVGYYEDNFPTLDSYLEFLRIRVELWYKKLIPSGHMVLHVDADFSDYIRVYVMDEVFGKSSFRNKIIWSYSRWAGKTSNKLNKLHQDLIWYTKPPISESVFNEIRLPLDKPRRRNLVDGKTRTSLKDKDGNIVYRDQTDKPIGDVWCDIHTVPNKGGERVDYPTQKPLALSERQIIMLTNENGIVFDPFMGSGTCLVAANRLNRMFIGMDNEENAFNKTVGRLQQEGAGFTTCVSGTSINIKGPDDMSDYEYQEFVVNSLGGLVGKRGSDGGIDGVIQQQSTGIAVTRKTINRQLVSQFATDLELAGLKNGIMVSPKLPSGPAADETIKIKRLGKVNINIKHDSDIFGKSEPEVSLRVEGFKVYADAHGFRHTIVNYMWKINEDDDQIYLFDYGKKRMHNKFDKTGMQDFTGVFGAGDVVNIQCIVSDSKGNSKSAELSYKF